MDIKTHYMVWRHAQMASGVFARIHSKKPLPSVIDGKFYIYVYADGISIEFNDFRLRSQDGTYQRHLRFPKGMHEQIKELLVCHKAMRPENFSIYYHAELSCDSCIHRDKFSKIK